MATTPTQVYNNQKIIPAIDPDLARAMHVQLIPSTTFAKGTVLGEVTGVNEIQRIVFNATGGTFKLRYNGQTTANITFSTTPATLDTNITAALEALSNIGVGDVLVGVTAEGGTMAAVVEFAALLAAAAQPVLEIIDNALTGGAGTAAVETLREGSAAQSGVFKPYASGNSDGSQVAKVILPYDCVTDAAGRISIVGSGGTGGQHGEKSNSIEVWYRGAFYTAELVGLDATAIGHLGRLISGSASNGILQVA